MKQLLSGIIALQLGSASADPTVLFDSGRTVDARGYVSELSVEYPAPQKPSIAQMAMPHTPEMSLGRVNTRNVKLPYLPQPMFLIGADDTSIRWLAKHKAALQRAGAVGLIVNASSIQQLQKAIRTAEGLHVSPASGSELAKQFGLKHYPVLITKSQIAQ